MTAEVAAAGLRAPASPASVDVTTNPLLFVVGAARSGTTLLQRLLDAHPLLAVVNETYWLPRKYRERLGLTRDGDVTPELLPMLLQSPKFDRMGFTAADLDRIAGGGSARYVDFVSRLFDEYAARAGKPYAGDKTPGYVRRMGQLHELWPQARFVHIVRDPRDVCLSMLDWSSGERTAGQFGTWRLDRAVSSALYWRYSVALGVEAGRELGPDHYVELRYEDLVAATEAELSRLCEFLGLPYDAAMLDYHLGRSRPKPGRSSKAQWLPPTAGLRDWATQLEPSEIARVELAIGGLLGELGYATTAADPAPAMISHVDAVRAVFTTSLRSSDRPIPRDW